MDGDVGAAGGSGPKTPKYDFYQTEQDLTLTVMIKGAKTEDCSVEITEEKLMVNIKHDSCPEGYLLDLLLKHPVNPEKSTWKVLSTKIEIKLRKTDWIRWDKVEKTAGDVPVPKPVPQIPKPEDSAQADTKSSQHAPAYPTSHKKGPVNWDRIEKDVMKEDEDTKLEGDAAVNQLFQKIYADSSDEVKKAMMKSYQESAGTCLSTNWEEVKQNKVEVKPPDCMEYKEYDH